ncbi:MAG TPA: hypothetical protein VF747_11865 [Blastocatellia bacterium]
MNRSFAWGFWTDVANWAFDTSIEWVKLDGPFASGTKGTTKLPGQEPVEWALKEVRGGEEATVEIALQEATLHFHWRFEDLARGGTRITQRVTLTGADADLFARQGAEELEKGIPEGMRKLATEMALAEQRMRDMQRA